MVCISHCLFSGDYSALPSKAWRLQYYIHQLDCHNLVSLVILRHSLLIHLFCFIQCSYNSSKLLVKTNENVPGTAVINQNCKNWWCLAICLEMSCGWCDDVILPPPSARRMALQRTPMCCQSPLPCLPSLASPTPTAPTRTPTSPSRAPPGLASVELVSHLSDSEMYQRFRCQRSGSPKTGRFN